MVSDEKDELARRPGAGLGATSSESMANTHFVQDKQVRHRPHSASPSHRAHSVLTPCSHRAHTVLTPCSHRAHIVLAMVIPRRRFASLKAPYLDA